MITPVKTVALAEGTTDDQMVIGAFTLTATELKVTGTPTFEEWQRIGDYIRLVNSGAQWWWGDWLAYGEGAYPDRYTQALETTGWGSETLRGYEWVAKSVPPVSRLTGVAYTLYQDLAKLPADQQRRWAKRAREEEWTRARLRQELRTASRLPATTLPAATGDRARVLLADPPWAFDDQGVVTENDAYGRAERHYATLSMDAIAAYRILDGRAVLDLVADDAVLFLWCPAALLLENPGPREVMAAWGFTPKTNIVWDKVDHNFGHYLSVRHEHLLLGTRGSCVPDRLTPMIDSVQTVRRSDVHSEKPPEFRQIIERLYDGPYRELFGRVAAPGWDVVGDQVAAV